MGTREDIARAVLEGGEAGRRGDPRTVCPYRDILRTAWIKGCARTAPPVNSNRLTSSLTPSPNLDSYDTSPRCTPSCPSCDCGSNPACAPYLGTYGTRWEQGAESIPKSSKRRRRR
ncbi:Rmf/CrpP fold protein [Streptomyces sp. NPDC024017]|uniref:Rmf/CrpP fold protein n=1 Tax=Streptomyces sp. NPDC024017 TaxID=3154326 RepID=UPI0033CF1D5F